MGSENEANNTTIGDMTLMKLAESMNQYAATSISSLSVPKYSGGLNEDIQSFLREFKIATITLNDETRCMAMEKALQGTAYIWAKNNIKTDLRAGNWKNVKRALIERFVAPNQELKHHEELAKLKFDAKSSTLLSFLEKYYECYRKTYKGCEDKAVIIALKLNLPNNVQRSLNVLNDEWVNFDCIKDLYKLARRAEEKILPFEHNEEESNKLDVQTFTKLLKDFKDSILKAKTNDNEQFERKQETLNVIQRQTNRGVHQRSGINRQSGPYNGYYTNKRPYETEADNTTGDLKKRTNLQRETSSDNRNNDKLFEAYVERYGKPPGPCYFCSGRHFNRHCPLQYLN